MYTTQRRFPARVIEAFQSTLLIEADERERGSATVLVFTFLLFAVAVLREEQERHI